MSGVALLLLRESREGAREGRQWELTGGKLTVGREEGCDIHLRVSYKRSKDLTPCG